jgi:RHS repeat-associated protein
MLSADAAPMTNDAKRLIFDLEAQYGLEEGFRGLLRSGYYDTGACDRFLRLLESIDLGGPGVFDRCVVALITTETSTSLGATRTFTNDTAGRVTKENTTAYAYDAAGELTKNGATTQSYDAASQLTTAVTGSTSTAYTFDARGDRTTATTGITVTTYGYDQVNRLTSFARGTTTASYTYNGDSLRASKTVGGVTTKFVYDTAEGMPLVLSDGASCYLYGPDGIPFEQITTAGVTTYLHTDQLGSIRMITGSTGKSVGTATYTAYGTRTTTGTTSAFGYAGQYTDTETGLQWLRARYYDPTTGQFLTVDPLTAATGTRYAYAAGNPITGADPSGMAWWNPASWTATTFDNLALAATAASLALQLTVVAEGATIVGLPAAAVQEVAAGALEVVASTASLGGSIRHFQTGDTEMGMIDAIGVLPMVGVASRGVYTARYAGRAAEFGSRMAAATFRQIDQGISTGMRWFHAGAYTAYSNARALMSSNAQVGDCSGE